MHRSYRRLVARRTVVFVAWVTAVVWPGLPATASPSNKAQTTIVSDDVTPPLVTVTSPAEGFTTPADRVTLVGTVKDAGSGVHHVACNGRPASLMNGIVRCVVPLLAGVNAVVLLAVDAAGNSASAGVRVLRDVPAGPLTMFPDTLRIGPHDEVLSVRTEAGTPPKGVRWSTSNTDVLTLAAYGADVQTSPRRPGEVIVTATVGSRTATASVTVLDTEPLAGALQWKVAPIAGMLPRRPIEVDRQDDESPDVYLVDTDRGGGFSVVRGIYAAHSNPVWRGAVPGSPRFADRFGGLISSVGPGRRSRVIGRFDRLGGKPIWQFEARGEIRDATTTEDGTIYLVVRVAGASARSDGLIDDVVVAVDGLSGIAKAQHRLPASTTTRTSACAPVQRRQHPSELGPLAAIGTEVYLMLLEAHDSRVSSCDRGRTVAAGGAIESSRTLRVVRISMTGIENVHTLWTWGDTWHDGLSRARLRYDAVPGPLFINPGGQLLATWHGVSAGPGGLGKELHVARVAGSVTNEVVREAVREGRDRTFRVLFDAFDAPKLYLSDGQSVEAIDLTSGQTKWRAEVSGAPFVAFDESVPPALGRIAVCDSVRGLLIHIDDRGRVTRTTSARIAEPRVIIQTNGLLHGIDPASGAFAQVAFPDDNESGWYAWVDLNPSYEDVRARLANLAVK